jgi:hypothetical protein
MESKPEKPSLPPFLPVDPEHEARIEKYIQENAKPRMSRPLRKKDATL